jgi:hypothetical protein
MRTILGGLGRRIPRPTPAMGVALLALLIACSGAAFATIPSDDGTITACRDNRTGVLRAIDAETNQTCRANETQLTWKNGIKGQVADALHADQADNADTIDGLDSSALQRRVSASCDPESAIRAIGDDGTVTCEPDDTSATQINADDMAPLPAVRARSSILTVENTTYTPLELNFEDIDQVGAGQTFGITEMHSDTTNKFTAPRAGIYEVQAEVVWDGSSPGATGTGERNVILRKGFPTCGGGSLDDIDRQYADPGEPITNHVSMLMAMNPGDTVILCGWQDSGEDLKVIFAFANMHYVSAK